MTEIELLKHEVRRHFLPMTEPEISRVLERLLIAVRRDQMDRDCRAAKECAMSLQTWNRNGSTEVARHIREAFANPAPCGSSEE